MNVMHTTNKATEHPRLILTLHEAMTAVKSANPKAFNCLLQASLLSHRAQIANTLNSLSVASREFPPAISMGMLRLDKTDSPILENFGQYWLESRF